jgi:hypothetical protein
MSATLDSLESLAVNYDAIVASLSPETLAIIFYALGGLPQDANGWIDRSVPGDDVSDDDLNALLTIVANAFADIYNGD